MLFSTQTSDACELEHDSNGCRVLAGSCYLGSRGHLLSTQYQSNISNCQQYNIVVVIVSQFDVGRAIAEGANSRGWVLHAIQATPITADWSDPPVLVYPLLDVFPFLAFVIGDFIGTPILSSTSRISDKCSESRFAFANPSIAALSL